MIHFKTYFIFIVIILTVNTTSFASWLIFHKPAFRGKVIDTQTKEPIEGAVVVVMYKTDPIISGPGGGSSSLIKIKETLTDEKGEFYFSSYTTIIQPNSIEDHAGFLIYKPGYMSIPDAVTTQLNMSLPNKEKFFLAEYFGKPAEIVHEPFGKRKIEVAKQKNGKQKLTFGLIELPRLKTREERLRAIPSSPTGRIKDSPLLYKSENEERKRFGLRPVGR